MPLELNLWQVIALGGGALVGGVWALIRYRQFQRLVVRECDAVAAGAYPPDEAYRRYRNDALATKPKRPAWLMRDFLTTYAVSFTIMQYSFTLADPHLPDAATNVLSLVFLVNGAASIAYSLLFETLFTLVERRIIRALRQLTLKPSRFAWARWRLNLVFEMLPAFAVIVMGVTLYDFTAHLRLTEIISVAELLGLCGLRLLSTRLTTWYTLTLPIARTPWAHVAERWAAWVRTAGYTAMPVYVYYSLGPSDTNIYITGVGRPKILVSDLFLAHSDWRQQDAMFGFLLGVRRFGTARHSATTVLTTDALVTVLLVSYIVWCGTDAFRVLATNSMLPSQLSGLALGLTFAMFVGLNAISNTGRRMNQRYLQQYTWTPDRFTAALTGDPLAQIVAIHTLNALNGTTQRAATKRMTASRAAILETILSGPQPRAAYGESLVPSDVPVFLGINPITVPLADAPPPQPVPTAPVAPPPTRPQAAG